MTPLETGQAKEWPGKRVCVGLSYREVALVQGVAECTVKSRVHHARRQLQDWFGAGEVADEL